jgi:hypothetical protein
MSTYMSRMGKFYRKCRVMVVSPDSGASFLSQEPV